MPKKSKGRKSKKRSKKKGKKTKKETRVTTEYVPIKRMRRVPSTVQHSKAYKGKKGIGKKNSGKGEPIEKDIGGKEIELSRVTATEGKSRSKARGRYRSRSKSRSSSRSITRRRSRGRSRKRSHGRNRDGSRDRESRRSQHQESRRSQDQKSRKSQDQELKRSKRKAERYEEDETSVSKEGRNVTDNRRRGKRRGRYDTSSSEFSFKAMRRSDKRRKRKDDTSSSDNSFMAKKRTDAKRRRDDPTSSDDWKRRRDYSRTGDDNKREGGDPSSSDDSIKVMRKKQDICKGTQTLASYPPCLHDAQSEPTRHPCDDLPMPASLPYPCDTQPMPTCIPCTCYLKPKPCCIKPQPYPSYVGPQPYPSCLNFNIEQQKTTPRSIYSHRPIDFRPQGFQSRINYQQQEANTSANCYKRPYDVSSQGRRGTPRPSNVPPKDWQTMQNVKNICAGSRVYETISTSKMPQNDWKPLQKIESICAEFGIIETTSNFFGFNSDNNEKAPRCSAGSQKLCQRNFLDIDGAARLSKNSASYPTRYSQNNSNGLKSMQNYQHVYGGAHISRVSRSPCSSVVSPRGRRYSARRCEVGDSAEKKKSSRPSELSSRGRRDSRTRRCYAGCATEMPMSKYQNNFDDKFRRSECSAPISPLASSTRSCLDELESATEDSDSTIDDEAPSKLVTCVSNIGTFDSIYKVVNTSFKFANRVLLMTPCGHYAIFMHDNSFYIYEDEIHNVEIIPKLSVRHYRERFVRFDDMEIAVQYILLTIETRKMRKSFRSVDLIKELCTKDFCACPSEATDTDSCDSDALDSETSCSSLQWN